MRKIISPGAKSKQPMKWRENSRIAFWYKIVTQALIQKLVFLTLKSVNLGWNYVIVLWSDANRRHSRIKSRFYCHCHAPCSASQIWHQTRSLKQFTELINNIALHYINLIRPATDLNPVIFFSLFECGYTLQFSFFAVLEGPVSWLFLSVVISQLYSPILICKVG